MSGEGNSRGRLVGAVDQGTTSTRFVVFDSRTSKVVTQHQMLLKMITPQSGWVEQDPMEILDTLYTCIGSCVDNLKTMGLDPLVEVKAIGITNQRETTIAWDKNTGQPLYNAIVWLDNRTQEIAEEMIDRTPNKSKDHWKGVCGLPISSYFSALKMSWLLSNVPEVEDAIAKKRCLFGTVDSWLIWNLTGGPDGGKHVTDVTNASRTMLMSLETLNYDSRLIRFFKVPIEVLPEIRSSSEIYGHLASTGLKGLPVSGCLGDQQSALVGQRCFQKGMVKNTYGTGCFLLYNTGEKVIQSMHGMLTTVGYKLGKDAPAVYALEGSIAVAGVAVRWMIDNMGMADSVKEFAKNASSVQSTNDVYFVPAFNGLYAPHWRPDARGIMCGLNQSTTKCHLARAVLEAICFQTRELLEAMSKDSGTQLKKLLVDGGMSVNDQMIQIQADTLGIEVVRPDMIETTSLGAAIAAGMAEGIEVWDCEGASDVSKATSFMPKISKWERDRQFARWNEAVQRCLGWDTSQIVPDPSE